MEPYFQDEKAGIVILHGDCREVLPTLERESVDMIVTDPPYGVRWLSGRGQQGFASIKGDESREAAEIALPLAFKVLRRRRHAYVFGRYDFSGTDMTEPVELIWDKGIIGLGNTGSAWGPSHEYIQFLVRTAGTVSAEAGDGQLAARLRRGSVLRYKRLNSTQVLLHPSEKPVMLLRELIESSSRFGDTVLDCFAGSGSTLEAARLEGRRCIGIEIEERYCEIAANRLRQHVFDFGAA